MTGCSWASRCCYREVVDRRNCGLSDTMFRMGRSFHLTYNSCEWRSVEMVHGAKA